MRWPWRKGQENPRLRAYTADFVRAAIIDGETVGAVVEHTGMKALAAQDLLGFIADVVVGRVQEPPTLNLLHRVPMTEEAARQMGETLIAELAARDGEPERVVVRYRDAAHAPRAVVVEAER